MRSLRFALWLALPVGLIVGGINIANAQVSENVRQACTPDAERLCSEFIPDAAKVKTCMMHKTSQLSEACRSAIRGGRKVSRHERRPAHHLYYHHHYHHHYYHHHHEYHHKR